MNRRSFFSTLAKATAGFMILPAATTYGRVWRAQRSLDYRTVILPTINQYGDLSFLANMNGIYATLAACGAVIEYPTETKEQQALFDTIFHNSRIPLTKS